MCWKMNVQSGMGTQRMEWECEKNQFQQDYDIKRILGGSDFFKADKQHI